MTTGSVAFPGFRPAAFRFLRELSDHNDPDWFRPKKAVYDTEVLAPLRHLVVAVGTALEEAGLPLIGDPRRGIFRIYRDVRFSKDKSPYKTHAACWFHHLNAARTVGAEADAGSAGYYFHLQPGGKSALGAGLWMPPRPQLKKLRDAIAKDPKGFDRMARSIPSRFGGLDDEGALKRMPRGYAEDHPAAKWLRFQSFTSGRSLTDKQVTSPSLASFLAREYEALLPLVRWLNGGLGFKPASSR